MEQQSDPEYSDILNKLDALIHRNSGHDDTPPQIMKQRLAMPASLSPCSLPEGERDAGSLRELHANEAPATPRVLAPSARQMDYPVLTDIVEAEPEAIPVLLEAVEPGEEPGFSIEPEFEPPVCREGSSTTDDLSPELQDLIDQRILSVLEKRFSQHLATAIDKALSVMLDQFSVHLEEVAREAVAEEIQKQLADSLRKP